MSEKLTERQQRVLARLAKADPDLMSFRGHARIAAAKLAALGFAEFVANDKWDGTIYRITSAGRAALPPNPPKTGEGK